MGLNRNINDDSTLAYLFNKTRQGASDALQKAIDAINATIATIQTTLNNKVDKSGDTMTGNLTVDCSSGTSEADIMAKGKAGTVYLYSTGSATGNRGIYCENASGTSKAVITIDQSNNVTLGGRATNVTGTVAIANGGTGATTAANALTNLGAVNKAGDTMTGPLYEKTNNITIGTVPSSAQYPSMYLVRDSADSVFGGIYGTYLASDQLGINIGSNRSVNGTQVYNWVGLAVDASGNRIVTMSSNAAWRTALGLGTSGALPITVAQGGTGMTGITSTTTKTDIVTAGSNITIVSAGYSQWGKVAAVTLELKATAAISSGATVATIVSGKRPARSTFAIDSSNGRMEILASSGAVVTKHAITSGTTNWIETTYLLP